MPDLVIIGAGGNSREIAEAAQLLGWSVIGFLDDDSRKWNAQIDGIPVLGPIDQAYEVDAQCINTLGTWRKPNVREIVNARINLDPSRWVTIIHPSAHISRSSQIGQGCAILAGVHIGAGARIGDHVVVLQGASVSHDCVVEDFATITGRASLPANVTVRRAAYIGMGATVLNGVTIGERAIVGLGSVVVRDVAPETTVTGNPANVLVKRA